MSIKNNLLKIKSTIPNNVKLVAVSKTQSIEKIKEVLYEGHNIFGENKVQEIIKKQPLLPSNIEWHFIGHLQTNKVKYIVPFISLIHSVDRLNLLNEINNQALKNNRTVNCLLQFHIAKEETKFGLTLPEAEQIVNSKEFAEMKNVKITGVMGMATFTNDNSIIRNEFKELYKIYLHLKQNYFLKDNEFKEISMGMSNDYLIAIEEGSTIVRIGTSIFGERK